MITQLPTMIPADCFLMRKTARIISLTLWVVDPEIHQASGFNLPIGGWTHYEQPTARI